MDSSNKLFTMVTSITFKVTIFVLVLYTVYTSLRGRPSGIVVILGLLFLYGFYYLVGKLYLIENYTKYNKHDDDDEEEKEDETVDCREIVDDSSSKPYVTKPINSIDDYEHNLVFQNENDREITTDLRNKLMSQYPMDWSTQPASSAYFSKGLKESFENRMPIDASMNETVYKNVSGTNLQPPDTDAIEIQERKMLDTYKAKDATDLNTYDIEDARELIKKIYDAKGLVPEVEHDEKKNIYTIMSTRKKGDKIQYEDDLGDATAEESVDNMENTTVVPRAATDILKDSDPFYDTAQRTRMDKWDYTKYTPELERMFAPTDSRSQWY